MLLCQESPNCLQYNTCVDIQINPQSEGNPTTQLLAVTATRRLFRTLVIALALQVQITLGSAPDQGQLVGGRPRA